MTTSPPTPPTLDPALDSPPAPRPTPDQLAADLAALLTTFNVPGGAVGILDHGQRTAAAAGIADLSTGRPVTPDAIFLTGSIMKVLTTTLVMQQVDAGRLDLDAPVLTYLPDFQLRDPAAAAAITVRHLLNHTSGIPGDYLFDPGPVADAIAQFAASLVQLAPLHPPGATISYSNAAFVLVAHLLTAVTGQPWATLLRDRLLTPLGMSDTHVFGHEVPPDRIAPGHRSNEAGELVAEPMWPEFAAGAPAGFTTYATVDDLLTFAAMHLNAGQSAAGKAVLTPASVAAMQAPSVTGLPSGAADGVGWGLGWALHAYGPTQTRVIGHNGGLCAVLRLLPDHDYAVVVLTNAAGGTALATALITTLVQARFGQTVPTGVTAGADDPPVPDAATLAGYAGDFHHLGFTTHITWEEGRLWSASGFSGTRTAPTPLTPLSAITFATAGDVAGPGKVSFGDFDAAGRPASFHGAMRRFRRQD